MTHGELRDVDPGALSAALTAVSTPPSIQTPLGSFDLVDGVPTPDSVERLYDALDVVRGVEVFMNCVPGASLVAMWRRFRSIGLDGSTVGYTDPLEPWFDKTWQQANSSLCERHEVERRTRRESATSARPQLSKGERGVDDRVERHEDREQLEPAVRHEVGRCQQAHDRTGATVAASQCFDRPSAMSTSDLTYTNWSTIE
jgi:hypothetical protein